MICLSNQLASRWVLLTLLAVITIPAQYAYALEIPCASFKDKCSSLIFRLGLPKTEPGEYVIADKTVIAPGYEAVVLNRKPVGQLLNRWGVFVVDSAGKYVLTLDKFPKGEATNLLVRLGKHSEGSLVVIGYDYYGFEQIKTKYFFDLASRKKLAAIKTGVDVDVRYVMEFNGSVYLIGNAISGNNDASNANAGVADTAHAIIAVISPPPAEKTPAQSAVFPTTQSHVQSTDNYHEQAPAFVNIAIVDRIDKQKIERILDARIAGGNLILLSKHHRYTLANGIWGASAAHAPKTLTGIRESAWHKTDQGVKLPGYPSWLILDREVTNTRTGESYPLPQPSYRLFSQWRPRRVDDGYTEGSVSLESNIGPWQLVNGQLWFGLYFYDGEGTSGVGGIGTFDLATKKYQISYMKEIAADSSVAMLVEPDTVWLGLGMEPEGVEFGTGIAKISRANGTVVRYKAPGIVNTFVRSGNKVFVGTADGVMVFNDDGRIENIELSINIDGSYSPVVQQAAGAAGGNAMKGGLPAVP